MVSSSKQRKTSPVKKKIRELIEAGKLLEAKKELHLYMKQNPDDQENHTLAGVLLILEGKPVEAEKVILHGLKHDPDSCDLLFNLAYLDELRREYVSAMDLYKKAELVAETPQQQDDIREAVQRVMPNIKSTLVFERDAYTIILEGNREPIQFTYQLAVLQERKQILDAILNNLDTKAKSAVEVDAGDWVIPKNMADLGLTVKAFAPVPVTVQKAVTVEFQEKFRKAGTLPPKYYQAKCDKTNVAQLPVSDVILLLPVEAAWYEQKKAEAATNILALLARKAKRQFFFHVPSSAGDTKELDLTIKNTFQKNNLPIPTVCWNSTTGSRLFRLDHTRNVKNNLAALLPVALHAVHSNKAVFEVEVEKCRDLNGMAYTEYGWNHFVALLKQLQQNPGLDYGSSVLKEYYDRFTPCNRQEQLFPDARENLSPLCDGWTLLPWMDARGVQINAKNPPHSRPGGNHHFGPNTDDFGKREFAMIKQTFEMIKRWGYQPEIFPDGYIQGYFLKKGDEYRFIINEGQHRMAAVGVLGYELIKCKHNTKFPRVVDLKTINRWPQVKSGFYSRSLAEKVFMHYFESDGKKQAQRLGLI